MTTLSKRRSEDREIEALVMANCLMLLSSVKTGTTAGEKCFTCKTCDRKFSSFQALGGHRASHKKPRMTAGDLFNNRSPVTKPNKAHACPICGQEFSIGQALGGHMRRHRTAVGQVRPTSEEIVATPILLKRSSSSGKRVVCLDLNLTPFENDVKLGIKSSILPSWLIV